MIFMNAYNLNASFLITKKKKHRIKNLLEVLKHMDNEKRVLKAARHL